MKYNTQNAKIKSITEKTLIVGIDVGSETHFARAFDWRNYEYSKKPLEFSNTEAGFMTLKAWMADLAEKYGKNVVIPGMEPTGHYWFNLGAYLQDNGYVEEWFTDGNMLRIKCEEVEAALRTTEQSLAKLHRLFDNKPIEYVAMALSGEMQAYCDIEDDMVKGMFGTIVQGYLKKGYNRATAEMMAREFFRYES